MYQCYYEKARQTYSIKGLNIDNDYLTKKGEKKSNITKRKRISFNLASDIVDMPRTHRTILTTLIHTLDAQVATRLRLNMKDKYGVVVHSIHDCFGCPVDAKDCLRVYKDLSTTGRVIAHDLL